MLPARRQGEGHREKLETCRRKRTLDLFRRPGIRHHNLGGLNYCDSRSKSQKRSELVHIEAISVITILMASTTSESVTILYNRSNLGTQIGSFFLY